jgi:hypothetical protein
METKTILNINYLKTGVYYDNLSHIKNDFIEITNFKKNYHMKSNALKNLFEDLNYKKIINEIRK